jgi:hypothetical protein
MPRTNQDGKEIKLVLQWLTGRHLTDIDMAAALNIPPTNYSRRKDADDYPTFEDLDKFAEHFGLSARALQVAFGYLELDKVLLGDDEMRQYVEQGGGTVPDFPARRGGTMTLQSKPANGRRQRRPDAPPGP